MDTGRIEAFSDGVFAVAITLLALNIPVPAATDGNDLWAKLADAWPQYAAYVVSFSTVGIIWVNHHAQFQRFARADRTLLFLNLQLLLWVVLIPVPTELVARFLRAGAQQHAAAAVYAIVLLIMSTSFGLIWRHGRRAGLLAEHLDAQTINHTTRRSAVGQAGYGLAVALAFVSAPVSLAICAAVALFYVHPGRRIETPGASP